MEELQAVQADLLEAVEALWEAIITGPSRNDVHPLISHNHTIIIITNQPHHHLTLLPHPNLSIQMKDPCYVA